MKKIILLAACLFTINTVITAQEAPKKFNPEKNAGQKKTYEERAQKNVDDINSVAELNEDQKIKIKELAVTRITKTDAIKTKYRGQAESKETERNEIISVRKEFNQGVKSVLTPEQFKKVKEREKNKAPQKSSAE